MSWLRARMCSGSSCRYSIACMACSVPSMPSPRRPGHKPCLPRMKRRAVSMVMVSMMTSWRAWQPDRSERLWHLVPCSLLSSGQRSVGPEAGCESWSHVPLRDLSLLLNCKLRPAPDHRKRDGIPPCALRVSCSASSCFPALPCRFDLDLLSTGSRIPQSLRYVEGFFFSQAKPEGGRRGRFLPIPSMG